MHLRSPVILAVTGAALLLSFRISLADGSRCSSPSLTRPQAFEIARRATSDSTVQEDSVVAFRFESKTLPLGRRCLIAVALSWDGQHSGAIVVVDSQRHVLFADTTYRDAKDLQITPRGRIVFVYNSLWGSGLWQTKAIALCPVSAESWIECLELILDNRISVVGRNEPGYFGQAGRISVVGDTIIWQRQDTIEASGRAWPTEYRNLRSSRIAIP